jgi:hypothetical protein
MIAEVARAQLFGVVLVPTHGSSLEGACRPGLSVLSRLSTVTVATT